MSDEPLQSMDRLEADAYSYRSCVPPCWADDEDDGSTMSRLLRMRRYPRTPNKAADKILEDWIKDLKNLTATR